MPGPAAMRASCTNPVTIKTGRGSFNCDYPRTRRPPPPNSHPDPYHPAVGASQIPIPRQRPERKELRVTMITQIKHPRKARCRVALPRPTALFRSVWLLGTRTPRATAGCLDLARRHQSKQGPCRLRGGGRRPLESLVIESVADGILAPAAVRVLDRQQPVHRLATSPGPGGRPRRHSARTAPTRCRRCSSGPSGRTMTPPRAGSGADSRRRPPSALLACAVSPSCASIETQRAVTSSVGGSSSAPWSENGMLLR